MNCIIRFEFKPIYLAFIVLILIQIDQSCYVKIEFQNVHDILEPIVNKVEDVVKEFVEKNEEVVDKVEEVVVEEIKIEVADLVDDIVKEVVEKVVEVADKVKEVVDKVEPVVPYEEAPKFEGTFYFDSWDEKIFVLQSVSYQKYILNFENHITVSNFFSQISKSVIELMPSRMTWLTWKPMMTLLPMMLLMLLPSKVKPPNPRLQKQVYYY